MGWLGKWLLRLLLAVFLLLVLLISPVAYVELACRDQIGADTYRPILSDADYYREESRTFLTYPEWHIVHAYDDYAQVIATGDPHDYAFLKSIRDFWSTSCTMSKSAAAHGGFGWDSKQLVYIIGVSFTAEFAVKALYEETVGRLFTLLRGPEHSALDALSARQAADYARFLQQVPWYKWDFSGDAADLKAVKSDALRDRERRFALGLEYSVKAAYAGVIEAAVANVGADQLRIRSLVTGLSASELAAIDDVTVIAEHPAGVEIETPRYRKFTGILAQIARQGGDLIEIAGNDDIMMTVLSDQDTVPGALYSFKRQGYGDFRHLVALKRSRIWRSGFVPLKPARHGWSIYMITRATAGRPLISGA